MRAHTRTHGERDKFLFSPVGSLGRLLLGEKYNRVCARYERLRASK